MANTNGRHYGDQRRVDGNNINTMNGVATGNSLSLEELFINGVGGLGAGNRYNHHRAAASSQDIIIRLDHPRPDVLRTRNEYVDVSRPVRTTNRHNQHHQHPASTTRQQSGRNGGRPILSGRAAAMDESWQPALAHRAHSVPLSASTMVCSPAVSSSTGNDQSTMSTIRNDPCLYCSGRPLLSSPASGHHHHHQQSNSNPNFDRVKITGPSKSAAALTSLNNCQPSTSSNNNRPPIPGRAIRVSNFNSNSSRNEPVVLPTTVISSQPRNLSSNNSSFDKKISSTRSPPSQLLESDCSSSSLMCKDCGRCRCAACTAPRTMPSRWLCNNSCLLSSESVLDAASCMCCVKGCLYHAGADSDDLLKEQYRENSDCQKPSSSTSLENGDRHTNNSLWSCSRQTSTNCCLRWTILTSALTFLPCLWCYLPMKFCVRGGESIYARCHDHGCRCDRNGADQQRQNRSSLQNQNRISVDRSTRRLRRKRSHTLPPELPSIAAAKAAAAASSKEGATTSTSRCSAGGSSEYS